MKNVLRLIFVTLFSVYVSAVVVQAQNYDLVSDSLAFVAASWKVTPLVHSVVAGIKKFYICLKFKI